MGKVLQSPKSPDKKNPTHLKPNWNSPDKQAIKKYSCILNLVVYKDDLEAIINWKSSFSSKTECLRSWLNMKIYRCNSVWIRELQQTDMGAHYQT